ncbi:site-specific integrase [Mycolicibacterium sp. 120270]|uniref:site-specific integrase n=1 Tax=Mycolicibacterium sp. 120270 TaxID=3090600 RepID=UPI00299E782E|nr:site-specific integrase [Mycolicibacterium sp. 120270]MDX1886877.1 site-specific integrase [Mycolicibacterium sp. 120270]
MSERRAERAVRLRREQPGLVRYTRPAIVPALIWREPFHFPQGDLRAADVEEIRPIAKQLWPEPVSRRRSRDRGLYKLTAFLAEHPGATWQQRWDASPLGRGEVAAREVAGGGTAGTEYTEGVQTLFALRIVRPTLTALRINQLTIYPQYVVPAEDDDELHRYAAAVDAAAMSDLFKRWALFDVCVAMTIQGVPFADLTPESFLHYAFETRETTPRSGLHVGKYVGHSAWQILYAMGRFPPSAPPTLRNALRAPQLTIEEMVDRYQVANPEIRDLFVAYLHRRYPDVDYASLTAAAYAIVKLFWNGITRINPDQVDLRISQEVYRQWHHGVTVREDGEPRLDMSAVLSPVRAFYLDLQSWAVNEPETWGRWVTTCPVPRSTMNQVGKAKRRVRERVHATVRTLQPLLPVLVDHVSADHERWARLLKRAYAAEDGEAFEADGVAYTRAFSREDRRRVRHGMPAKVRVLDGAGRRIDVNRQEDSAFWAWAIVETLRHSGLRIEELTELSQLSVRQYRRPNGEVIALLVVAPSKTDRERVIPMSAELFHVIACIIRRLTEGKKTVPMATRFDIYDRVWSDPQPFLFQRHIGQHIEVMTTGGIAEKLRHLCQAIAQTDPRFEGVHFRPHDFRRLFATELVNNGLPIHIGAALLGHLNLETTRGYVAVFSEDVILHYQTHLQRRRRIRPAEEYPAVTDDEWAEFQTHFDKRKVELGSCGRPYATPCIHEHACVRCPLLNVDPRMLHRLDDLEADLIARRQRADDEGWQGEIEGIELTLGFLRGKRQDVTRRLNRTHDLGMPIPAAPTP